MRSFVRANLLVRGQVEDQNFPSAAQATAQRLNLSGWVRSAPAAGIEVEIEGPKEAVASFIEWCQFAPPPVRVETVEVSWRSCQGDRTFRVH